MSKSLYCPLSLSEHLLGDRGQKFSSSGSLSEHEHMAFNISSETRLSFLVSNKRTERKICCMQMTHYCNFKWLKLYIKTLCFSCDFGRRDK